MDVVPRRTGLLSRHGWLVVIALAYLYGFPYFPKIQSANELPRVYLVKAIADEHRFAIDTGVARWGSTADVSPSAGHVYSNKAPGSSMLAAPPYLVVRLIGGEPSLALTMWICRVFAGVIPMLLFLALVYRFLERYTPDPAIRQLVCLAYGLGSMAMTYSIVFYSHQLAAACVGSAWMLGLDVADGKRRPIAMLGIGALAGASALVDYQAVFAAVPVAVHLVVRMSLAGRRRELGFAALYGLAGALVPIAILLAYHAACFGSPFRTGYDASVTFAEHHQHGFLGLTKLRWEAFWGSLFKIDNGLFVLSPWLLLAFPGLYALARRRHVGTAIVGGVMIVLYVAFISAINFWRGGWGVGPRYITALLPFLLPAVAIVLDRLRTRGWLFAIAVAPILVAIAIYVLSSLTFPYWPDSIAHPLYDVTLRLLGDGLVAPNLGTAIGLPAIVSIVPVVAAVIAIVVVTLRRITSWPVIGAAAALAAIVLLAYGLVPHGGPATARPYRFVTASIVESQ